jgi:RHS repeat-associated protein
VWNAENRRITIESRASVPTAGKVKEQWTYLPDGRWVERIVSTWNLTLGTWNPVQTNRYVWDGQVLLAVLNHTNGLELAFLRGVDLSGTLQGAVGVGGLLAVRVGLAGPAGLANTTHFVCNDGNDNVAGLVNAADGTESARYDYGPFAEPLRITGVMGRVNPIRYSTQYEDDKTGDIKYLYRDLRDGRWLSRDPIEEEGGLNLYGFANNNAPNYYDRDGRFIGVFIGIGVDLTVQITANVATGRDWYDINVSSVVISGAVGLVAPGIGQVVKGVKNAGRLSTAIAKTKSKIPLRKNPSRIDRLNRRMQQQVKAHNQQVNKVARDVSIAAAWQASKFVAKKLADEIENEVKNMDGCPNDGYGLGASDSLEERVAVDPFSWNPFKYVDGSYYEHNGVPSEITIER